MPPDGTATIAQGPEDLHASVKAQIVEGKPTFFKLEAQLPKHVRTGQQWHSYGQLIYHQFPRIWRSC